VLPDAAHIQEEDARDANRHDYSKHKPALPLYTKVDAARALERLQPIGYQRPVPVVAGMEVEFVNAGHLLGSAFVRVRVAGRSIVFSGDLGRYGRPVLPDPSPIEEADVLLLESTYGDRLHEPNDDGAGLAAVINAAVHRGGKVIIPSFAIGRVEEVLYWVKSLEDAGRIPVLPVYVDSPMAAGALQFYRNRLDELDPDIRPGERSLYAFCTQRMVTVASAQQSRDLVASRAPAIVIASSGMATGGRVLFHLAATLPNPKNTVLFVGYQAAGTRGRSLVDNATEVRIKGQDIPVHAQVEQIGSMSAHADADEIMRWLAGFRRPPALTYLVHGEPPAAEVLKRRIEAELRWPVQVAGDLERVDLPPIRSA
jgi:metallo-beta-lactamase family protein